MVAEKSCPYVEDMKYNAPVIGHCRSGERMILCKVPGEIVYELHYSIAERALTKEVFTRYNELIGVTPVDINPDDSQAIIDLVLHTH